LIGLATDFESKSLRLTIAIDLTLRLLISTLIWEDAEDFSFGLWAANVMNSPERQHILLETLVDAPIDRVPDHAEVDSSPSLELKKSWLGQGGHSDAHRRESAG
jgi:hypothetical protein